MNGPLLACEDLELRAGARHLVRGLDLSIGAGERWVAIGPNGAGKSTLLAVLAGARPADGGRLRLRGRPMAQWPVQELAAQRALVTDRWLDPFAASVLSTVLTGRHRLHHDPQAEAQALRALSAMDCGALAGRDVRQLSRGERQRVAIATALAQDTPLLLLDEPTAHQDPGHQAEVLARLAAMPGRTWVAALHDINAAATFATHALLLSGQGPWQAGPVAEVLTAEALSGLFDTRIVAAGIGGRRLFVVEGRPRSARAAPLDGAPDLRP